MSEREPTGLKENMLIVNHVEKGLCSFFFFFLPHPPQDTKGAENTEMLFGNSKWSHT